MDYIRQTIDSEKLAPIINLPVALRGRKVEVIILPVAETQKSAAKSGAAFGCLHKYANPSMISKEDGIWEQAVMDKYANR